MTKLLLIFGALFLVAVIGYLAFFNKEDVRVSTVTKAVDSSEIEKPTKTSNKSVFYPLTNYSSRIKERQYGQYFSGNEKVNAPCGKPFVGFHTGDDLETDGDEVTSEVPVVGVVDGRVLQVGFVSGYGGLIIQSASLEGKPVTIYYGHLDLDSIDLKPGDMVEAGKKIGNLGDECSTETDDARKHLHLSIRNGTMIDVRGYAPTEEVLNSWVSPKRLLESLNASTPQ